MFANTGFYIFVRANSGSGFQVLNDDGSIETGSYSSYTASGTTAPAAFTLNGVSGNVKFVFANPLSGTISLTLPSLGGYQNGDFIMFTNPVPTSMAGQNLYVNVQDGGGLFASSGDFIFAAASSGSTYTITAIGAGGANSYGTYSYSRPNTTCGSIQLNDELEGSSTVCVAFTNSVTGGYYLTSASGYQAGYATILNAQAPASIAGDTFIAEVTAGTSPTLANSGYFLFLPTNSTGYEVIGLAGVTNSTGTYSYSRNGADGMINLSESIGGSVKGNFFYFNPLGGSYALASGSTGQYTQTGNFAMLTNPVPNLITGQGFYITVTSGGYPYAVNGSFTFSTAASGNGYNITTISGGGLNSNGTYSYSKLNASCGGIQLTDSVIGVSTAYLAMSNSVSGGYVLTQPSTGGYQIGYVTILNTAVSIMSPTTASTYTNNSGNINLGGTANDNLGIAQVTWSNNRGGSGTASGTTAWTASGISLQIGTNVITVTAYDSVSNTAQAFLTVIYPPDTAPPTLSITNLVSGQRVSNAVFTVKGTAGDNWQVSNVLCQVDGGGWNSATNLNNWTNWSAGVALIPGTNTVAACAVDTSGNLSVTSSVRFQFVVTNQLQIRAAGLGTISPNYSNAWLNLGQNYSITSAPAVGFIFTNWTVSTNWLGGALATNRALPFTMASNLTLQASFVETNKPTLTITAPASGQHMSNAVATVAGTAGDVWKVSAVWYQLTNGIQPGGTWSQAGTTNSYTNWSTTLTLAAGTNTVKAYAVNLGGNYSATNSVSFVSSNSFKLQLAFGAGQPLGGNGLSLVLQLSTGLAGHIQVSTNLVDWVALTNFTGTNATLNFRDAAATNFNDRFYRAVVP